MKWLPDWFNDIGFIVTSLGFVITIWQLLLIRNRQKVMEQATNTTILKINNNIILYFLGTATREVSHIKTYIVEKNYRDADNGIVRIKEALTQCREANILSSKNAYITGLLQRLGSNQVLINTVMLNEQNTSNFQEFFTTLDDINTIFVEATAICQIKV